MGGGNRPTRSGTRSRARQSNQENSVAAPTSSAKATVVRSSATRKKLGVLVDNNSSVSSHNSTIVEKKLPNGDSDRDSKKKKLPSVNTSMGPNNTVSQPVFAEGHREGGSPLSVKGSVNTVKSVSHKDNLEEEDGKPTRCTRRTRLTCRDESTVQPITISPRRTRSASQPAKAPVKPSAPGRAKKRPAPTTPKTLQATTPDPKASSLGESPAKKPKKIVNDAEIEELLSADSDDEKVDNPPLPVKSSKQKRKTDSTKLAKEGSKRRSVRLLNSAKARESVTFPSTKRETSKSTKASEASEDKAQTPKKTVGAPNPTSQPEVTGTRSRKRFPSLANGSTLNRTASGEVSANASGVDGKRVPIWKRASPKPEPVNSKKDDVYEIEFSDSEAKRAKPKKKRAPRKPKDNDDFKSKAKLTNAIRFTDQEAHPPPAPVVPTVLTASSSAQAKPPTKKFVVSKPDGPSNSTVAESSRKPCAKTAMPLPEINFGDGVLSPIRPPSSNDRRTVVDGCSVDLNQMSGRECSQSVSAPSNLFQDDPPAPDSVAFKSPEASALPATLAVTKDTELENCFGFDDMDSPQVESTPMREPGTRPVPFLSPILKRVPQQQLQPTQQKKPEQPKARKMSSSNRPARLDAESARDLIRSKGADKHQATIREYIAARNRLAEPPKQKDVVEDRTVDESNKPPNVPQTPPSAFAQPPRRSYSKRELRQAKRTMFQDEEEKDSAEEQEEEEEDPDVYVPGNKKKRVIHKKKAVTKRDAEADAFFKLMNKEFEEIDKFELSV